MTRQKGVALLVVLMILAIMAALASEMTVRYQINLKRTSYTRLRLQQNWLAELAESQAMRILEQDLRDNEKYLTHEQLWAQPQRIQLASGDVVSWQLSDEQACYNINALINAPIDRMKEPPASVSVFLALLENIGVTNAQAEALVDAIADYIDNDDIPRASGAENEYYQTSNDPHTIGGRRIWSISELKQIKGMTLSLYQQISPLLCALPDDELKININTLTRRDAPLLAAMLNNAVPPREIERFFDTPRKGRKISIETLLKTFDKDNPAHKLSQTTFKSIAVATSRYFRLETTIEQGDSAGSTISQLEYDPKRKALFITARKSVARDH
ncbi:hypothetical protein FDW99_01335 [Citrobacter sp. wls758]|uniref:type II secretion system minor pseudopilin GspK n=1 Tax=Citrobacter TaxID=544 RepID=UPI00030DBC63|nr:MULTISPECIES: type II secretion system minor pseudopilin GspK [Citrobacter]MDH1758063.1 type II secretion system minor pseudopilin GspK [Citrobacter braakii]MDH1856324.1 type II secretion system minor pseudopilin GspK [Citrobacter braakii]TKU34601.1 hypothetical protein FDW99_01335 [Citrobacter sp. wls758]